MLNVYAGFSANSFMQFKRKVVMEVFSDTMQIITIIVVIGAAFQTFAGADGK